MKPIKDCNYRELEQLVIHWAEAREIIPCATPGVQLLKLVSEVGELCDAEGKKNIPDIKDGIGDIMVCLINYCALRNLDLLDCLAGAYEEIKFRRGTLMPDGTFVKFS